MIDVPLTFIFPKQITSTDPQHEYVTAITRDIGFSAHRRLWHYRERGSSEVVSFDPQSGEKTITNLPTEASLDWIRYACTHTNCCNREGA